MSDYKLLIRNDIFGLPKDPQTSKFHIMGTKGFSFLTYMIWFSKNSNYIHISPSDIMDFFKISSPQTNDVIRMLSILQQQNIYIKCDRDLSKLRKNENTIIDLSQYFSIKSKYELIPEDIFLEVFKEKKNYNEWSILCLLSKFHNISFGGITSQGYGCIRQEYIADVLDISRKTVIKNIEELKQNKYIKVIPKETYNESDAFGNDIYKSIPNKYIVKHKTKK